MLKSVPVPKPDTPSGRTSVSEILEYAKACKNPFAHPTLAYGEGFGSHHRDWVGVIARVNAAVDAAACIARSNFHEPAAGAVLEIARMVLAELDRPAPGGVCK